MDIGDRSKMWIKTGSNNLHDVSGCSLKVVAQWVLPGKFAIRIEPYIAMTQGGYEVLAYGLDEGQARQVMETIESAIDMGNRLCDITAFLPNAEDR